jgi:tetratricopeptide (TPR) repeat protein
MEGLEPNERAGLASMVPESEKHPLTKLEGIDLYDRARLEQEGIVNVESFAHHDLIRLVLETRIPVPQLVDWMDQAILYLHCVQDSDDTSRQKLRAYGIRTTTDLLACWEAAEERKDFEDLKKLLDDGNKIPHRLEVIRDALLDDEWLHRVENWRDDSERAEKKVDAFPKTLEAKLKWAKKLEDDDRYNDAINMLEEAIKSRDDAQARVRLAHILATSPVSSLRDTIRSRENARRAFELGKRDLDVLFDVIDIHDANGDIDDALEACEQAILVTATLRDEKERKRRREILEKTLTGLKAKKPQAAQSAAP